LAFFTGTTGQSLGAVNTSFGTERMRIDSSGNVGIGVTPSAWSSSNATKALQIATRGSVWSNVNSVSINNNWYLASGDVDKYITTSFATRYNQDATGIHQWFVAPSGVADSAITFTQAMTLDNSGNLLVGTTSAYVSSRFRVKSSGAGSGTYNTELENSAGTVLFTIRDDGYISTGVAAASPYNATTASAANCHIYSDGGLYRSTSSRKYKRDITDYTRGLADVLKLRPVFYKGKSENDGDTQFAGLIAEEVADAGLDEFVVKAADGTADALAYSNMVALTVKAIQELKADNDALRARVAALELN